MTYRPSMWSVPSLRSALRRRLVALGRSSERRALRRRRPGQRERFELLAGDFANKYERFSPYKDHARPFITPLWERTNAHLERILLPRPPFDFLNDATVVATMFQDMAEEAVARQIAALESELGPARLAEVVEEDHVGAPPLRIRRYNTSSASVRHLDLIIRYMRATACSLADLSMILEWGGGYGDLAKVVARLKAGAPLTYVIIDTPLMACLQWIYLGTIFGPERVHLLGSPNDPILSGRFNLVNVAFVDHLRVSPDLFISTWALSESSAHAQRYVAEQGWFGARRLLLAYHRAGSPVAPYFEGDFAQLIAGSGAAIQPNSEMSTADAYAFR